MVEYISISQWDSNLKNPVREPSAVKALAPQRDLFSLQQLLAQLLAALCRKICRRDIKDGAAAGLALICHTISSPGACHDHGGGKFRVGIQL